MRDEFSITIAMFALVVVTIICGMYLGVGIGATQACNSVKMEWVKDKCMKVTREEVK